MSSADRATDEGKGPLNPLLSLAVWEGVQDTWTSDCPFFPAAHNPTDAVGRNR